MDGFLSVLDNALTLFSETLFGESKGSYEDPKYVQDTIPITKVYEDGIFEHGKNLFSKTFYFSDVNYALLKREAKEKVFLKYEELLNSFDTQVKVKLTICNHALNETSLKNYVLFPYAKDALDTFRAEKNQMIENNIQKKNAITQDKYLTVMVNKQDIEDARIYFKNLGVEVISHLDAMGSACRAVLFKERLRIFHDFYRAGEEETFCPNILNEDVRDYICPYTMEWKKDYFKLGNRYGRVLFLKEYAAFIKDHMLSELTDLNQNLMLSIDIEPVAVDQAIKEAENRLLGIETNITNWQRRQNQNNNFSATIPYELEQQKQEMKEFLDDLTTRDQKMMSVLLTLVHTADTKEQLDSDTESLLMTARRHMCKLSILKYQQLQGLNTALPFGLKEISAKRTLTTESLAVLMPFRTKDIFYPGGIYYGQNVISKNSIVVDRKALMNGNSFILGVSGSGKSFMAKDEITSLYLKGDNDVIIIDPEREYSQLVTALGGEVVTISAASNNHINTLDISKAYSDGTNPIALKSEFIISLCEQLMGEHGLTAKQKSIIDRCMAAVYKDYLKSRYTGDVPTLKDFHSELLRQEDSEAKELAFATELFVKGSLNTFADKTNVETNSHLLCYDIFDLGKQLTPIAMLIILDAIFNRITKNSETGRSAFIFIDEIYLLFENDYSANFLFTLWKRVRKHNAFATGITQNVDDLLQSHTARTMLANSEFVIMLNQAATDRDELMKLLDISEKEAGYITNADVGNGLIRVGKTIVPFENQYEKNTKLYKLMTTKPGE